jgi:hypothetical protein
MARKNGDADGERSKVKIFYAEAEGTSQSIQDLLRGLTAAMGSRPVQSQPRLVAPNNGSQAAAPAAALVNEPENLFTSVDDPINGEPVAEAPEQPRRKRGDGNGNRDRNSGLSLVKSLDLMPEGKETLKVFVNGKNPQNQMEHIAVYIYYLKAVLEEQKVGFDHVFTCFKETGERMPLDLPQTCRNAASSKGWIDTAEPDDLKITTKGVNFVEKELPMKKDAS